MALDHVGIDVADLASAGRYFGALMPLVGFEPFASGDGWAAYWPTGGGTQLFLYAAADPGPYVRAAPGLQHLAFAVGTRAEVDRAHAWALEQGDEVQHAPQVFAQYHERHYATYWAEPNGFTIEVVSFEPPS